LTGRVYNAQGFEFDYVGVISGRDLRSDPATNDWLGDPSHSHCATVKRSGECFTDLVKRTYNTLLAGGLKGSLRAFRGRGDGTFPTKHMDDNEGCRSGRATSHGAGFDTPSVRQLRVSA